MSSQQFDTVVEDRFHCGCFRPSTGRHVWEDQFDNIVVKAGLNELFANGYTSRALYLLPIGMDPVVDPLDTMASHAGWTELVSYSEAARQIWTPGTVVNGGTNNSASPGIFTFTSNLLIGGAAFTTSVTKGGTSGILIGAGAFTGGNHGVQIGDLFYINLSPVMANAT